MWFRLAEAPVCLTAACVQELYDPHPLRAGMRVSRKVLWDSRAKILDTILPKSMSLNKNYTPSSKVASLTYLKLSVSLLIGDTVVPGIKLLFLLITNGYKVAFLYHSAVKPIQSPWLIPIKPSAFGLEEFVSQRTLVNSELVNCRTLSSPLFYIHVPCWWVGRLTHSAWFQ